MKDLVVVDTNVVFDSTRGRDRVFFSWLEGESIAAVLPALVVFEIYVGQEMTETKSVETVEFILSECLVLDFTPSMAKLAGELVRKLTISAVEASIAATYLFLQQQFPDRQVFLATKNKKHFRDIPGIKFYPLNKPSRP